MNREYLRDLQNKIESLRPSDADYVIVSVGTCAKDFERDDGFAEATVRMGNDTATSRAKYLDDAINLARNKIIAARKAETAKREKEKNSRKANA